MVIKHLGSCSLKLPLSPNPTSLPTPPPHPPILYTLIGMDMDSAALVAAVAFPTVNVWSMNRLCVNSAVISWMFDPYWIHHVCDGMGYVTCILVCFFLSFFLMCHFLQIDYQYVLKQMKMKEVKTLTPTNWWQPLTSSPKFQKISMKKL